MYGGLRYICIRTLKQAAETGKPQLETSKKAHMFKQVVNMFKQAVNQAANCVHTAFVHVQTSHCPYTDVWVLFRMGQRAHSTVPTLTFHSPRAPVGPVWQYFGHFPGPFCSTYLVKFVKPDTYHCMPKEITGSKGEEAHTQRQLFRYDKSMP